MKFLKFIVILAFSLNVCYAADSPCGDWVPFKDEKCFKLVDDTLRTYADAEKTCAHLEGRPSLPVVRSQAEQDFLTNYAFKTMAKLENVWIGARLSQNKLTWIDHSNQSFTNWQSGSPRNKPKYDCVQMQADDSVLGKWIDEPCEKKGFVMCQKMPTWSISGLEKALLDARKEFRDGLENTKKECQKENLLLKQTLEDEIAKKDRELKQNLIPLGFIYVQLPGEQPPSAIWPWLTWSDVSASLAGVFFRVAGGGAAEFGQVQPDNSPRLVKVEKSRDGGNVFDTYPMNSTVLPSGDAASNSYASGWIYSGDNAKEINNQLWLRFHLSGGEVRPRNMAVRVWKRTG